MRDYIYPVVIAAAKTWFKLGDVDIRMTGMDNIPEKGGVLLAVNHLSFVDYVMAGFPGVERGRLTRFMAKKEVFDHAIGGPVMLPWYNRDRKKTFFFFTQEFNYLSTRGAAVNTTVPTAIQRSGNFSGVSPVVLDPRPSPADSPGKVRT